MPLDRVRIRQGANLPHWETEGCIYSVTFRLSDSLPQQAIDSIIRERDTMKDALKKPARNLTCDEKRELHRLYSEKVDSFLNAGHGSCCLQNDAIAQIVANALQFFGNDRYELHAWCIMPNHMHVIVEPLEEHAVADIVHTWKSFTALRANKALGRSGAFWQTEYFDHIIRNEQELMRNIDYVWDNPDQAGLHDWKWRWKREEPL